MEPRFPFEASWEEIQASPEAFVAPLFASLESEFLILPTGEGFVDYPTFEGGYEALKLATRSFQALDPDVVLSVCLSQPIAFVVLRCILGFTPPEWAFIASQRSGRAIDQGFVRSLDRQIRLAPLAPLEPSELKRQRMADMVQTGCQMLVQGAPEVPPEHLHRLGKADTAKGLSSLAAMAQLAAPYAMLLYERLLGRPFASHRDSVSELVGDNMESAVEEQLSRSGISFRKTQRAERIAGFDQTPDFIVPDEFNPQVVIEAKVCQDDGTARDKVTRIQHLGQLAGTEASSGQPKFEVVACIGGRGFAVRTQDMMKMLLATRGKVFTFKTLNRLVECTRLRDFRTK